MKKIIFAEYKKKIKNRNQLPKWQLNENNNNQQSKATTMQEYTMKCESFSFSTENRRIQNGLSGEGDFWRQDNG